MSQKEKRSGNRPSGCLQSSSLRTLMAKRLVGGGGEHGGKKGEIRQRLVPAGEGLLAGPQSLAVRNRERSKPYLLIQEPGGRGNPRARCALRRARRVSISGWGKAIQRNEDKRETYLDRAWL